MTGFKAWPPPARQLPAVKPPAVLADGGKRCGAKFPGWSPSDAHCDRPAGHAGGHLSGDGTRYWQSGGAA